MKFVIVSLIFLVFLVCVFIDISYQRHGYRDGKLYRALHIQLPGWITVYYPEQLVELEKWSGSKYDFLRAVNEDGSENPEVTAGLALRACGLYTDYKFKKKSDGHWILWRSAKTGKCFTMQAFYRLGPWQLVEK